MNLWARLRPFKDSASRITCGTSSFSVRGARVVRGLHYSAAGDVDETAIRSVTLCVIEVNFIHALLTKHVQYLAHLVMLDLRIGQANDLILKTAEDLGEPSLAPRRLVGVGQRRMHTELE